ncbi:MAG: hypothetical protein ACT4PU_05825 [Planctomycetota bacterium]
MSGFPWRAFLLLAVLAVVLRVGTNLSRTDEILPEGLVRGVLTQAWLDDVPVWPAYAPQIPHLRGSVVMSALAVPAFAVFGPTTFAVRLPGLVFHLAALWLFMALAQRFARTRVSLSGDGRRAALCAGALFVLAPPSLAKSAVLAYGDHIESLPFVLAALLLVHLWIHAGPGARGRTALGLGIVTGLAVSFHAQARLGVAAVALGACLATPGLLRRRELWTAALPGLLLGLVPLALGDWLTATPGLAIFGRSGGQLLSAGPGETAARLAKWWGLFSTDLMHAFQYPWPGAGAGTLIFGALAAVWLLLRRPTPAESRLLRLRTAAPLLAWIVLFSVAYAFTRFRITHGTENAIQVRFVAPVLPLILLPIALAAAALWEERRRAVAALLLCPPLLLGAWGSLSTIDLESVFSEPARSAVAWEDGAPHLLFAALDEHERRELRRLELSLYGDPRQEHDSLAFVRAAADPLRVVQLVERYDLGEPEQRPLRFWRLALPAFDAVVERSEIPEPVRPYALVASGRRLAGGAGDPETDSLVRLLALCRDGADAALVGRGVGLGLATFAVPRNYRTEDVRRRLDALPLALELEEVAFGLGFELGAVTQPFYPPGDARLQAGLGALPPQLLVAAATGVGAGFRQRFLRAPSRELSSPSVRRVLALLARHDSAGELGLEEAFRNGLAPR